MNLNSSSYKIKVQEGCTDNGVSKIMSIGKVNNKKLLVVSIEQNITVLKIGSILGFEGIVVGYNDEIIDLRNSKPVSGQDEQSPYFVMVTNSNNIKVISKANHRL